VLGGAVVVGDVRGRTAEGRRMTLKRQNKWGLRVKANFQHVHGKLGLAYLIHRKLRLPAQLDLFVLGGVRRIAMTAKPSFEDQRGFLGKVPTALSVESILVHAH
jgi:hypothetical protein